MRHLIALLVAALAGSALAPRAAAQAIVSDRALAHPVQARRGMSVAQEARAAAVGRDVLAAGGNAVDAAVAVGFALAVTLPRAGNLGGGGFMLIHHAPSKTTIALDFREVAPASAHRDMFVDEKTGEVSSDGSRWDVTAVGVPGSVAGLIAAHERFGSKKLTLAQLIAPAIALAREMRVSPDLARNLAKKRDRLAADPAAAAIFLPREGRQPPRAGDTLRQSDLAATLTRVAEHGRQGFYQGPVAEAVVKATDGRITADDLRAYRVAWRAPVIGTYRGLRVASMPMPSSGGVHLVQLLNILEGYPMGALGHNSAASIHALAEAMRRAYADRSKYLGDPSFFVAGDANASQARADEITKALTAKPYATRLRASIGRLATPSDQVRPGARLALESDETTHYSVADEEGSLVACTTTLNFSYGCCRVAPGTGVLLNNEMDDFSARPGVPNAYGLLGGKANAIAAGKRPLSSMTPTLVFRDGQPWLATGSPGGPRIITATLQLIVNLVDHEMNLAEATRAPRVHHQWWPDQLRVERGISPDTLRLLRSRGHRTTLGDAMGSTQSVLRLRDGKGFRGASDPRRPGAGAVGLD